LCAKFYATTALSLLYPTLWAPITIAGARGWDREMRLAAAFCAGAGRPDVAGSYNLSQIGGIGKIKYEVGYLFCATTAKSRRSLLGR
jgi:hypothetical protein